MILFISQVACILGGFFGSLRGLYKKRSFKGMIEVAYKGQKLASLILAPAAPVMTEAILRSKNASDESIYDRSYRIRANQNQVRVDRYAGVSGLLGTGVSLALKKGPLPGFFLGFGGGTIAGAIHNSKK